MTDVQIPTHLNPKDIALERFEEMINCLGNLTDITPEGAPEGTVEFKSGEGDDLFFYTKEACEIVNLDFEDVMKVFVHCLDDADILYVGFEPFDMEQVESSFE